MTSRSKKTLHAAEQDRPDVAAARAKLKVEQSKLRAPRLVFIDETAVTTKMVRHRGRSPRGERLVASVPHGHWKTLTLVAALRINGLTAPYVINGAMDGPSFLAYVEQILAPTLRKGDIVFMDNLRTHKIDGVRQAVEAVGAKVRYLPAYSPDLNPIEMAFSKLKTALRKGGRSHRENADETDRQAHQDICTRAVRELLSTCRVHLTHIKWKPL
jgi:transposase